LEEVLRQRYDKTLVLGVDTEGEKGADLIKKYTLQKFSMKVNGAPVNLNYLGHEYDNDLVKLFIEVDDVSELKSVTVSNSMLTEVFEEQQNIVHVKRYKKRKSLVLDGDNPKGTLNF
nr:hypothetical protein [Bacteroidota bacterium]